jgi:hypothetical protein
MNSNKVTKENEMKSGAELISKERMEQIQKHNWNAAHDDLSNEEGELSEAAAYLITGHESFYPAGWEPETKTRFFKKNRTEQLIIAGALLAAEIDRLKRLEEQS